jgi:superfamily II DNA helicase RecQ
LYFFTIPALNPQLAQEELNRFCSGQRVVAIERQFVEAGISSFWSLCVSVASGPGPLPDALKTPEDRGRAGNDAATASNRVDYKEVLSEADFAVYAELRNWRKETAKAEGVAVYRVFTNEQLAAMVQRRVDSLTALGDIEGIGRSRLERYGKAVLVKLQALLRAVPERERAPESE